MSLVETIKADAVRALKSKDQIRLSTLRMLLAAVKNKQIELRRDLTDPEVINVIGTQMRKRRESIQSFQPAGRTDLVEKETSELGILSAYFPAPLTREEIELEIDRIIQQANATSHKDLGKVMKAAISQLAGRAEGKLINEVAKAQLAKAP